MVFSSTSRVWIRVALALVLLLVALYFARPLYWKLSSTMRENKTTVGEGISEFVFAARKSIGWFGGARKVGVRWLRL